ncbi:MAG: hypothetical protein AAF741_19770 [Bacteroidota bacterium]
MNSKRFLFTLVFTLFHIVSFAQRRETPKPTYDPDRINLAEEYVAVHIEPISYMRSNGALRLGATVQIPKLSFVFDYSYGQNTLGGSSVFDGETSSGYRFRGFRPEFRVHWPQYWGTMYGGIEYYYEDIKRKLDTSSYYDPSLSPDADIFAFESGNRRTFRHGILLKIGHTTPLFRTLYLDVFCGLGHTWRNIRFQNLRNVRVDLTATEGSDARDGIGISGRFRQGRTEFFTLQIGARVGIRFEKLPERLLNE